MSFIRSDGSTKVHTWLVYIESISDFMLQAIFLELISDIASM
jgi:hypothetical protein